MAEIVSEAELEVGSIAVSEDTAAVSEVTRQEQAFFLMKGHMPSVAVVGCRGLASKLSPPLQNQRSQTGQMTRRKHSCSSLKEAW